MLFLQSADFAEHGLREGEINTDRAAKRSVSLTSSVLESTEPVTTASCNQSIRSTESELFKLFLRGSARTSTPTPLKQHVGEASNTQPPDSVHRAVRPSSHGALLKSVPSDGWLNSQLGNRAAGSGSFGHSQVFLPRCLLLLLQMLAGRGPTERPDSSSVLRAVEV